MSTLRKAMGKLSAKNILAAVGLCIIFGCGYAYKKGSISAAIVPTLLGLVLFLGSALYLALKAVRLESEEKNRNAAQR
ncbi:hypothetical protein GX408_16145 [bacterium]|nr:hypothetical protein [bacterium]